MVVKVFFYNHFCYFLKKSIMLFASFSLMPFTFLKSSNDAEDTALTDLKYAIRALAFEGPMPSIFSSLEDVMAFVRLESILLKEKRCTSSCILYMKLKIGIFFAMLISDSLSVRLLVL